MVRNLHPTIFHRTVQLFFGKKRQLDKVIEEIQELLFAVHKGDRDEIMLELADVELTLPYLKLSFLYDEEIRIERMPDRPDFDAYSFLVLILLRMRKEYGDSVLNKRITSLCIKGFCNALYELYIKYNIEPKDIDSIIDYKKRRTLKRIVTGYYINEEEKHAKCRA